MPSREPRPNSEASRWRSCASGCPGRLRVKCGRETTPLLLSYQPKTRALERSRRLLLTADALVAGIDADLSLTSLPDLGWKAMAVNLSDIAAMGGVPGHALVSVVGAATYQLSAPLRGDPRGCGGL